MLKHKIIRVGSQLSSYKKFLQFFSSKLRYWFLLLLTLALNIVVIIAYKAPKPNTLIPTKPELRVNNSLINPILFYVLGGLHTLFSLWMVLEYFIVTWPHFVLPKFLYKIKSVMIVIKNMSYICSCMYKIASIFNNILITKKPVNFVAFTVGGSLVPRPSSLTGTRLSWRHLCGRDLWNSIEITQ